MEQLNEVAMKAWQASWSYGSRGSTEDALFLEGLSWKDLECNMLSMEQILTLVAPVCATNHNEVSMNHAKTCLCESQFAL